MFFVILWYKSNKYILLYTFFLVILPLLCSDHKIARGTLFFSLQERWACLTWVFSLQVSSSADALCLEGKMTMVTATQGSPTGMLVVVSVELVVSFWSPNALTRSALQIGCTCLSHKPYQENPWLHCNCKWLVSTVALHINASTFADHWNQSQLICHLLPISEPFEKLYSFKYRNCGWIGASLFKLNLICTAELLTCLEGFSFRIELV